MIAASLRRLLPPERLAPCIMRRPQVLTRSINHAESAAAVQRFLTSIDAILLQSGSRRSGQSWPAQRLAPSSLVRTAASSLLSRYRPRRPALSCALTGLFIAQPDGSLGLGGASRGHLERCGPGPDGQRAKSNEHQSGDLALGEANLKLLVTGRVEAQSHS